MRIMYLEILLGCWLVAVHGSSQTMQCQAAPHTRSCVER
jgi:hypothetical protein